MAYFATKTSSIEFVRDDQLEKLYFHYEESKKMSQIYRSRVLDGLNWASGNPSPFTAYIYIYYFIFFSSPSFFKNALDIDCRKHIY